MTFWWENKVNQLDQALHDWVMCQSGANQNRLRSIARGTDGHALKTEIDAYVNHKSGNGDELYRKTLAYFGIPAVIPD
jgi:hypothetical protein